MIFWGGAPIRIGLGLGKQHQPAGSHGGATSMASRGDPDGGLGVPLVALIDHPVF